LNVLIDKVSPLQVATTAEREVPIFLAPFLVQRKSVQCLLRVWEQGR
jgi:hypothetical protein